jgi:drug/metabolite transporter (DMT)-like permease
MNKVFGIIGSLLFVGAVVIGYFCHFESADIVAIALSAFGLASIVVATVKKYNTEGKKFDWKFILVIALTVVGAVLVAVGGLDDSIFATLAGAVIGILTVIFGVIVANKKKEVTSK